MKFTLKLIKFIGIYEDKSKKLAPHGSDTIKSSYCVNKVTVRDLVTNREVWHIPWHAMWCYKETFKATLEKEKLNVKWGE